MPLVFSDDVDRIIVDAVTRINCYLINKERQTAYSFLSCTLSMPLLYRVSFMNKVVEAVSINLSISCEFSAKSYV